MELVVVDKNNYKEAIKIQKSIFPEEDGTINILASLDREQFIENTGISYIDDHIKYYLARGDGHFVAITGIYYYNFDEESAWIGWYGVLDEFRNRGLGKELLEKTIELASSMNFKYLRLYTDFVGNSEAIKLYEKMGFVGEKYTAENLSYDCRIYSIALAGDSVPLWNDKNLSLSHQSELDHMSKSQIDEIVKKYERIFGK